MDQQDVLDRQHSEQLARPRRRFDNRNRLWWLRAHDLGTAQHLLDYGPGHLVGRRVKLSIRVIDQNPTIQQGDRNIVRAQPRAFRESSDTGPTRHNSQAYVSSRTDGMPHVSRLKW